MTLAMKRIKNLGWLALVFTVAILLYPLSLNVAALHSDLVRVDQKIMETKREISFLEAELSTRANVQQLEEWNQLLYGYEPPTAAQFLDGERALASLGGAAPVVKPVMVSATTIDGVEPAGIIGKPGAVPVAITREEVMDKPEPVKVALKRDDPEPVIKPETRTEKLAKIDERLLSEGLMRELQKKSDQERRRK